MKRTDAETLSGESRNDADVAAAVRHTLEWSFFVPAERIKSTVSKGWVTLEGEVERGAQRSDAEVAVSHLAGVRGVTNHIAVKAHAISPHDIRQAIKDALERRADQEAAHVSIDVHDGSVTLRGAVHTWAERAAIVGAARSTHGVRNVEDKLTISA